MVPMDPKMAVGVMQAAKQWTNAEIAAGRMDLMYMHADGSGARPETSRGHAQFSIQSMTGASLRIERLRSGDGASIPALLQ
jgi:hypothetical protein